MNMISKDYAPVFSSLAKNFLMIFLLLPTLANAHEGHDNESLGDLFFELPEQGFFLREMDGKSDSTSYVKMPDGTRYLLNSEFWKAAENIVSSATDDDDHDDANPVRRTILTRIREMSSAHFWMDLSIGGAEMFQRYGPLTFVMYATAEVIEHSLLPGPPICVLVQAGCVLGSQQLREVWNAARYRNPTNRNIGSRIAMSIQIIRARYQFWRAMRWVFSNSNGLSAASKRLFKKFSATGQPIQELISPSPFWSVFLAADSTDQPSLGERSLSFNMPAFFAPLDDSSTPIARLFAAEEQLAFLEIQLRLAKQALSSSVTGNFFLLLRLRMLVARLGRAQDRYGLILRQLAFNGTAPGTQVINQGMIEYFIQGYFEFNAKLTLYLDSLKKGLLPVGTVERNRLFALPKELNRQLRQFQKTGQLPSLVEGEDVDCEESLETAADRAASQ